MVKVIEFRVRLPMTAAEYQVAQLYSVAEASKNETGGGDGIEVLKNHPITEQPDPPLMDGYTEGQYTHKIYHIEHKIPWLIRKFAPNDSLSFHEKAWNAYPYCRTIVTNDYMKGDFFLKIETMHVDNDDGNLENVHKLSPEMLKMREIVYVDIANDPVRETDYKEDEDPTKYKSTKTGRGPLVGQDWHKTMQPMMCAYKLVTYQFKWKLIGSRVENFIGVAERRIFLNFHRQVFCWTDRWHGMTMEDIRKLEEETKEQLDNFRAQPELRGTIEEKDKKSS